MHSKLKDFVDLHSPSNIILKAERRSGSGCPADENICSLGGCNFEVLKTRSMADI